MGYHVCSGSVSLGLHPLDLKPLNYTTWSMQLASIQKRKDYSSLLLQR